eukprot:1945686-Pyramimonas_sp.AAC.2
MDDVVQVVAVTFGGLLLGIVFGLAKQAYIYGQPDTFALVLDFNEDRSALHLFSFRGWGEVKLLQLSVREAYLHLNSPMFTHPFTHLFAASPGRNDLLSFRLSYDRPSPRAST